MSQDENIVSKGSAVGTVPDEDLLWRDLLPCLLNIGDAMMVAGADVRYVERTLSRLGFAYGAENTNVLVITAAIIVTITSSSGREYTQTRRIDTAASTDFKKLEALNDLCRECFKHPLSAEELQARIDAIDDQTMDNLSLYGGGILACGAFAIFFGGSWVDGIVAALIGGLVCYTLRHWKHYLPNALIYNFAVSLVAGILIGIVAALIPGISRDMVTIGVIMVLIPGVAMTNSIRDLIAGDTISGVMRLVESLLWAGALALGFMLSMYVMNGLG